VPSGGRSSQSCITLAIGLLEEESAACVYLVGSSKDELWLQLSWPLIGLVYTSAGVVLVTVSSLAGGSAVRLHSSLHHHPHQE
jgi:hypothetical protein